MTMTLASLTLAVIQGLFLASLHFVVLCLTESWARATEQLAFLVASYSLVAYIAIFSLSAYGDHYILGRPVAKLWLVWISRFASSAFHLNAQSSILEAKHAINASAPRIGTALSSIWDLISRSFSTHFINARIVDFKSSMPHQALYNMISFFAQPHVIHMAKQISAILLATWLLIAHINSFNGSRSKRVASNKNQPTVAAYVYNGGDEEAQIYWLLKEIATNCDNHWRKYFHLGCRLEKGASVEQVDRLEQLLYAMLPRDFRIFLRITNGLKNILDGSGGDSHLRFASTHSDDWASEICARDEAMQDQWVKYLVEALFGSGTYDELIEQTKLRYKRQYQLNFIRIASHEKWSTGLFLVPSVDFRNIMEFWFPIAHDSITRNGSIIERIRNHEQSHFGKMYHQLETLQYRNDWTLLQVQRMEGQTYCRLYPSLTAYLHTLAELTRRRTTDLMTSSIDENYFAQLCRLRWEAAWTEISLYEGWY